MLWPEFRSLGRGWQPWREVQRMQREMNRLLEGITVPYSADFPGINIWTGENDMIVTSEIPGIDPSQIDISVKGEILTISGSRKADELKEGETYHRQERNYGTFSKTIQLPFRVDADRVDAHYEKGILILKLPRPEEEKTKKIDIKTA
jgi:HSP20 family protein